MPLSGGAELVYALALKARRPKLLGNLHTNMATTQNIKTPSKT